MQDLKIQVPSIGIKELCISDKTYRLYLEISFPKFCSKNSDAGIKALQELLENNNIARKKVENP